ncbi:MAG: hypothetical protein VYD87_14940 [Pseudomonadota bacterium]|nr:hypothetical protein [Pseudomonadota bacterium]MEE3101734.1 hypothetical protein [Pseudomonadota bacterium]
MIPDASDPRWRRLLTTDGELEASTLATRLLVSRLRRELRAEPAALPGKIEELRGYARSNPAAAAELARL